MTRRVVVALVAVSLAPLGPAAPQQAGTAAFLDLADPVLERRVASGIDLAVTIRHRIPNAQYRVSLQRERIPIPELELELVPSGGPAGTECPTGSDLRDRLLTATTELRVRDAIRTVRDQHQSGPCDDSALGEINAVVSRTEWPLGTFRLRRGERLIVNVERLAADATVERTWEFLLSTEIRGEWRVHYGFTFSTFVLNEDREYFSKVNPDADRGGFIVTEKRNETDLDIAPSVLFSWLPASSWFGDALTFTAGLGYEAEAPQLFVGPSFQVGANITLTGGLVLHKVRRLDGKFEVDQVIDENLEGDDLTQRVYRPNLYLGVGFRFSENPFGGGGEEGDGESEGPETGSEENGNSGESGAVLISRNHVPRELAMKTWT